LIIIEPEVDVGSTTIVPVALLLPYLVSVATIVLVLVFTLVRMVAFVVPSAVVSLSTISIVILSFEERKVEHLIIVCDRT